MLGRQDLLHWCGLDPSPARNLGPWVGAARPDGSLRGFCMAGLRSAVTVPRLGAHLLRFENGWGGILGASRVGRSPGVWVFNFSAVVFVAVLGALILILGSRGEHPTGVCCVWAVRPCVSNRQLGLGKGPILALRTREL